MFSSILIRNFLLIENLDLDFEPGFSVLTGETGAGKSIFLKAILFCLAGGKFGSEVIRPTADSASVCLTFLPNQEIKSLIAEKVGIEISDELIIKRIQQQNNRKKFFINNELVTQELVQDLSRLLLEFHGQNLHNYLADPASHIEILDKFGDLQLLQNEVSKKFQEISSLKRELSEIERERKVIDHEISYLEHIVRELQDLEILDGEEEKLLSLKIKIQSDSKRKDTIVSIAKKLEESNIEQIALNIQKIISKVNIPSFEQIANHLERALIEFDEARLIASNLILDNDEIIQDIDEVEKRLFDLKDASRKHNKPISALPSFLEESETKLRELQSKVLNYGTLQTRIAIAESEYQTKALGLKIARTEKARILESKINDELAPLKMEDARFFVEILDSAPASKGIDKVVFSAFTNKGMKAGQIDKIASGGELARFMLAVRVSLFDPDFVGLIIFDEIDTGLGGQVASRIGRRLLELGKINQVLVISHQPQVASLANNHYKIAKLTEIETTTSEIIKISGLGREQEIARMLSADNITDASLAAAKELLSL